MTYKIYDLQQKLKIYDHKKLYIENNLKKHDITICINYRAIYYLQFIKLVS